MRTSTNIYRYIELMNLRMIIQLLINQENLLQKQLPLLTDAQNTQPSSNFQIATQRSEMQRSGKIFVQKKINQRAIEFKEKENVRAFIKQLQIKKLPKNTLQLNCLKIFLKILLKQSISKMRTYIKHTKNVGCFRYSQKQILGITADQMIKQLIHHWLDQSIFQDYRKFKLDPIYITSVDEINKKFEETLLNLYDEQINQFSNRMINQIFSLKEKQFYIEGQVKLSNRGNQQLYQKTLQLIDRKPNYRALTSDVVERLQIQEEKLGKFDLIQNKERRKQMSLNLFVQKQEQTLNILISDNRILKQ